MKSVISTFKRINQNIEQPILVIDNEIPLSKYCRLDLSITNGDLRAFDITDPDSCEQYMNTVRKENNALVPYGGYLEERDIYKDKHNFSNEAVSRTVHLGLDFWINAGTKVLVPLDGEVHSFKNNTTQGDYGPTIILKHKVADVVLHTLYGHLSLESIKDLQIGQKFIKGETLATLGTPDINVNYAPHLHFQIIFDMEGYRGDYPGVCSKATLDFFKKNCPDPNRLLQLP